MMRLLYPFYIAILLSACASVTEVPRRAAAKTSEVASNVGSASASAVRQTREGLTDAALSPLEDLNLKRDEIPARLARLENPYHVPAKMTCQEIAVRIAQLDELLGPDWDVPEVELMRSQRLADSAANTTLKALSSEARGIIPFRGVVRMATGASKHARAYNEAYRIGAHRRTYLKGYGMALGCEPPARPRPGMEASPLDLQTHPLKQPVIVGLPPAQSSNEAIHTETEVEIVGEGKSGTPIITYRPPARPADVSESPSSD